MHEPNLSKLQSSIAEIRKLSVSNPSSVLPFIDRLMAEFPECSSLMILRAKHILSHPPYAEADLDLVMKDLVHCRKLGAYLSQALPLLTRLYKASGDKERTVLYGRWALIRLLKPTHMIQHLQDDSLCSHSEWDRYLTEQAIAAKARLRILES